MTRLPQMVSLHESTVISAQPYQPERRRALPVRGWCFYHSKPDCTCWQATTIKVHPLLWETALRLADGRPSRIRVHSATEVLVTNG